MGLVSRLPVLFIFNLVLLVFWQNFAYSQCSSPKVEVAPAHQARAWLTQAKKYSANVDVSNYVDRIEKLIKENKIKYSDIASEKSELAKIKQIGLQAEYKRLQTLISQRANFGDVPDTLISQFKKVAEQVGVSSGVVNQQVQSVVKDRQKKLEQEKAMCGGGKMIDLSRRLGPVRDQDGSGWCYAYCAADLIGHKLSKRSNFKENIEVSAIDITIHNNDSLYKALKRAGGVNELSFRGGTIRDAINGVASKGVCHEKNFTSDDASIANLAVIDAAKKASLVSKPVCTQDIIDRGLQVFGNINAARFTEVFTNGLNHKYLYDLADNSCGQRISLEGLEHVETKLKGKNVQGLFDVINDRLNQDEIVSIAFDGNSVYDQRGLLPKANHCTVVVGKKWDEQNQQCQYLLRTTAGADSCGDKCKPRMFDASYQCNKGHLWVPKSHLAKSIYKVDYVK